ncbi:hypothetical protein EJB05_51814, partial [Eragrostis curvula]
MDDDEDRISGLPDELLHCILVRLGSVHAAARTSVLSRRWRPVWTRLPELLLNADEAPQLVPSFPDAVDAALAAYSAPTLERLEITVPDTLRVPPHRLAPWLRFASQRVVDTLSVHMTAGLSSFFDPESDEEEAAELDLPPCGAAKKSFSVSDVSICSDSLHTLTFWVTKTQRLEIVAPNLVELIMRPATEFHVSAPMLADIDLMWQQGDTYDPRRHQFADVGRRLQLLDISRESTAVSLTHHFVEVTDLRLLISIANGIEGVLPNMVSLEGMTGVDCIGVQGWGRFSCPSSCPCRLVYSHEIDDIALSSLEVVEISSWASSPEELEFVEQLSRCKAAALKKLVIKDTNSPATLTKTLCEMIRSICRPDLEIEFLCELIE